MGVGTHKASFRRSDISADLRSEDISHRVNGCFDLTIHRQIDLLV